jgi:hypothetical protein
MSRPPCLKFCARTRERPALAKIGKASVPHFPWIFSTCSRFEPLTLTHISSADVHEQAVKCCAGVWKQLDVKVG